MENITKRPVVVETEDGDVIAIRPIMNMVLGIDHRANDGAQAAAFLNDIKGWLEVGRRRPADLVGGTDMGRELPIFEPPPPAGAGHAPHHAAEGTGLPIAIGGGGTFGPAADGSHAPRRHPDWIRRGCRPATTTTSCKRLLRGLSLNTVCEEAHCPNIGECWDQRTATIMILGDTCTRACGFCAVKTGRPTWFDDDEPRRVAEAVRQLDLEHVVVTSVARDDLPDGGAHDLRRDDPPPPRHDARAWASRCSSPTSTARTSRCGR